MTELEIKKRFRQAGCWRIVTGAKHDMAINDSTGQKIPIPRHSGDIPKGTAHKILKVANLE
ncbi:MAG: type II toxin-antitoxin system HicA family toxin [Treponema sp.]|nr:type II toxin-antitoxin system HicA family toxin [Treponema sp.]